MKQNQVIGYSRNMAIVLDEEDRLYGITCTDPEYYFPLGAAVSEELLDGGAKGIIPGSRKNNQMNFRT